MQPLSVRFFKKVKITESCWLWIGAKDSSGYGNIGSGGRDGQTLKAHFVSYLIRYGQPPIGLIICHTCDNKSCVNPSHLYAGTYADNYRDRIIRGDGGMKTPVVPHGKDGRFISLDGD